MVSRYLNTNLFVFPRKALLLLTLKELIYLNKGFCVALDKVKYHSSSVTYFHNLIAFLSHTFLYNSIRTDFTNTALLYLIFLHQLYLLEDFVLYAVRI
jgi:hypothetical protein